jgi:hypothetical protein
MPKWFINWEVESAVLPADPKERVQLWITLTQWVVDDLKAGTITDWGIRSGELGGYGISKEMSAEEVNGWLIKWTPYIKFQANPVLNAEQQLAALKQVAQRLPK